MTKVLTKWHAGWSYSCDECDEGSADKKKRPVVRIEFRHVGIPALHLCRNCVLTLQGTLLLGQTGWQDQV